jgi:aryl-alcohol dehydrogenase-like predicted oxidoreductase
VPLTVPALCLGGNVFGWTADRRTSFAVLDAALAAGITFLDTADTYSSWAHGGVGGQSEEIIGAWLAARGVRGRVVLATKLGMLEGLDDLRPATVRRAAADSLRRLGVDRVDLLYAHRDDGGDLAETFAAFDALVRAGDVGAVGVSNFSPARLAEAADLCAREGFAPPEVTQPRYSLMERAYERGEREVAEGRGIACVPYQALAAGFLTGKYRPGAAPVESARARRAGAYLDDPRAPAVLDALDAAAAAHDVPVASVALAWLRDRPTVAAPIASARTVAQVAPLAAALDLRLTAEETAALDAASRGAAPAA